MDINRRYADKRQQQRLRRQKLTHFQLGIVFRFGQRAEVIDVQFIRRMGAVAVVFIGDAAFLTQRFLRHEFALVIAEEGFCRT
ncbi:hypothetical protein D3C73_1578980 [compost metagenome]